MTYKSTITRLILLMVIVPSFVFADDTSSSGETGVGQKDTPAEGATEEIPTLEQVTVVGQAEDTLTVSETISRQRLGTLPKRNGSINEAINILPGIQTGEFHRTSDNAGEILPPDLSISGGRTYENNFIIDGLSNNSLLDPTNSDIDNISNVPGHSQQSFLHPSLVENITVYRSNISARYGNFSGGVVDIETRDPSGVSGGEFSLRHTRSEWTSLHMNRDRKEEYLKPGAGGVQPKFRKYDGTILLDIPITERTSILASYTRVHSKIPLYLIKVPANTIESKDQYRTTENFFLKAVTHFTDNTKWSVTGTFNPYEAEYFRDEVVNGDYTLENFAYGLTSKFEHRTNIAGIEFGLGYSLGTNSREADNLFFNWQVTNSKPWGAVTDAGARNPYSKEGGFGDIEKEQETLSANIHVVFDPIGNESSQHNLGFGFSFEQSEGSYDRTEELAYYTLGKKNSDVICGENTIDCIDNEQFMWFKTIYPQDKADVRVRFYDAYIEDLFNVGRATFRPGLRFSRDDLQNNINLAPRIAAGFDLFGDGKTNLYAGYNRYYGKTLMTHALGEQKADSINWTRSTKLISAGPLKDHPQEWAIKPRGTIAATQLSDLDTPFSDEITFGINQKLFDGLLSINYLEREGEDELALTVLDTDPDTGYRYTEWTNAGQSNHKETSISWERIWQSHYLFLAVTWQETETSNSDYAERADYPDKNDDGTADPVWYRGSLVERLDLPRPDFNRELAGNLVYTAKLPYNFTFTNVTHYRSGYEALEDTGKNMVLPSGISYDIYDSVKQPESWIFDWRLEWEKLFLRKQSFTVSMELNNVFNQKVSAGAADDIYELGRQFWLGMAYKF